MDKDAVFVVEDMNFDGLNDIRLMQFVPAAPQCILAYYCTGLAIKPSGKFQRAQKFDDITSPEFDRGKKLISSSWRGGWGDYGSCYL